MRLAFLGTPEIAAGTLAALVGAGHDVRVVVTRADARRGRGGGASPSPVKQAALDLGLPVVHTPGEALPYAAQLGVVVAYGRLIKPDVLHQLPMVNIHFSLLPRWRGAAPVERAILAGDARTGVCLMALEEGLDTGPIYACQEVLIAEEETAAELRQRLSVLGTESLVKLLRQGLPEPVAQEGEATYAAKLQPHELELDFPAGALSCHRKVRAGRAWTTFRGRRFIVHRATVLRLAEPARAEPTSGVLGPGQIDGELVGTGEASYALRLIEVQPESKPRMRVADWLRGARPAPNERLGH